MARLGIVSGNNNTVVDIVKNAVKATSVKLANVVPWIGGKNEITFIDGTWTEITNWIDKQNSLIGSDPMMGKYPMVALVHDIVVSDSNSGEHPEAELLLLVCTLSQRDWDSEQRRANTFKPILIPIYNQLIKQLSISKGVVGRELQHTMQESYHLHTSESMSQYKLNDVVDGIFIKQLKIKLTKSTCNVV